ncbi:MAG TPA: chemotaxis protein CheR, partial [Planctomycetaceae bacterium]|nr:chemotaxis protein CheR [Planctomycetaceae bacterium]
MMPVVREYELENLAELVDNLKRPGSRDLAQKVFDAMTTN